MLEANTLNCVSECTPPYHENRAGDQCINYIEFPPLFLFFTTLSAVIVGVVLLTKKLNKATRTIPSLVAMVSLMEYLAIVV